VPPLQVFQPLLSRILPLVSHVLLLVFTSTLAFAKLRNYQSLEVGTTPTRTRTLAFVLLRLGRSPEFCTTLTRMLDFKPVLVAITRTRISQLRFSLFRLNGDAQRVRLLIKRI